MHKYLLYTTFYRHAVHSGCCGDVYHLHHSGSGLLSLVDLHWKHQLKFLFCYHFSLLSSTGWYCCLLYLYPHTNTPVRTCTLAPVLIYLTLVAVLLYLYPCTNTLVHTCTLAPVLIIPLPLYQFSYTYLYSCACTLSP